MSIAPYYEDETCTIYHGDCREVLPELPAVDLVLADPPYSARTHHGARTNRWDMQGQPLIDFESMSVAEIRYVFALAAERLHGWCVAFVDWRHVAELEKEPPADLRFVRMGVWVKPDSAPQFSGDRPGMGWEAIGIFHSETGRMRWNGGGHRAVWTSLREKRIVHPAQKPLALVKRLAAMFSNSGDTILDPFMGSGTVLRAVKDTGCYGIGIEKEERYCEAAANRLRQRVLF